MNYLSSFLEAYHRSPVVAWIIIIFFIVAIAYHFGHDVIAIVIEIIGDAFSNKKERAP